MAKEFTPRYEETEGTVRDRMLGRISDEWRKEPGDFIYDSVAPTPLEVVQLQVNQDSILKSAFAQYSEDEDLDEHLYHVGLTRMEATPNQRKLFIEADAGVIIPKDYTASVVILDMEGNPLEFTTDSTITFEVPGTKTVELTCLSLGSITNVPNGSEFILLPPIPGVRTITDGGTTIPARDRESNESALIRYEYRVQHPDTGGNKYDYSRWSSEVPGVGNTKVIPRWNGPLTVKVIVVDAEQKPATPELIADVQSYLDPGSQGLGEGKAPMGAQVTVAAATNFAVNIEANVTYIDGTDPATVKASFQASVTKYLRTLVFTGYAVSYNKVTALLGTRDDVINFTGLTINGVNTDLDVPSDGVATLGTVTI